MVRSIEVQTWLNDDICLPAEDSGPGVDGAKDDNEMGGGGFGNEDNLKGPAASEPKIKVSVRSEHIEHHF